MYSVYFNLSASQPPSLPASPPSSLKRLVEQRSAEPKNNEAQNVEGWFHSRSAGAPAAPALARRVRRVSLNRFYKIDRIHSFDIRYSLFFFLRLALADMKAEP
jgi:hypothetical protein